jgi:hypothetical protein
MEYSNICFYLVYYSHEKLLLYELCADTFFTPVIYDQVMMVIKLVDDKFIQQQMLLSNIKVFFARIDRMNILTFLDKI